MKIETYLSPNCSESTFAITNWKTRKIQTLHMNSDSVGGDTTREFIIEIWTALLKGLDVSCTDSNGDSFHPEIVDTLKAVILHGDRLDYNNDEKMTQMSDELIEDCNDKTTEIINKYIKSKVELMAEGYYTLEQPKEVKRVSQTQRR